MGFLLVISKFFVWLFFSFWFMIEINLIGIGGIDKMFMTIVVLGALVYFFVKSYNRLQALAATVKKCHANILAALVKCSDSLNKLQELLAGYEGHEKLLNLKSSDNLVEMTKATKEAMMHIQNLVQTYPDIKANATYQQVMNNVRQLQAEIGQRRVIYNEAVANYNTKRNSLPEALYAGALGFPEAPFYDPDNISAVQEFKTDDGTIVKAMLKKGTDNTVAAVKNATENISNKIDEAQQKHLEEKNEKKEIIIEAEKESK